jgi:Na+/H+ antiporter NhaA
MERVVHVTDKSQSPRGKTMTTPRHVILKHFFVVATGVVLAVAWANTTADSYFRTAQMLAFTVNDVGMALALAFLAQEILEAMLPGGTLHRWRREMLPIAAGIGGVLGATAVYAARILFATRAMCCPDGPSRPPRISG